MDSPECIIRLTPIRQEENMDGSLKEIRDIKLWIDTGEMNLTEIEVQLDWIVENGLAIVDMEDSPEEALAAFTLLNAFLSAAASKKPSLVKKLSNQIQKTSQHQLKNWAGNFKPILFP